ncbi:protein farnesyltransferase subunit beta [Atheta coriaria]|uniref:protein farnesyltransferase subunit beta n=1 Tax=Dalotia coriaria TaxID=877792 RepID=UPI0031F3B41E
MQRHKPQTMIRNMFNHEHVITKTADEQLQVERNVKEVYDNYRRLTKVIENFPLLKREDHIRYLMNSIVYLPRTYECLDSARTWLCYWSLHSLSLLDHLNKMDAKVLSSMIKFLGKCQSPTGGFGGGPGQLPHLAATFASVNALCIIGTEEAYKCINRQTLRTFLWSLRSPEGAFSMHIDGEIDIRGAYCALTVATLTDIASVGLFAGTAEWVKSCQTYEGGFSGYPGMEAHGGYTFCGVAALVLLQKLHLCDSENLLRWIVNRQTRFEGGFQGRTNKLVDGCYSFWQAGAFALLHELLMRESPPDQFLFNNTALQEYILICCQHPTGGLKDKPGKRSDLYHTCYVLSGLSIAQTSLGGKSLVLGPAENEINKTNFVYNINPHSVLKAKTYYQHRDIEEESNAQVIEM